MAHVNRKKKMAKSALIRETTETFVKKVTLILKADSVTFIELGSKEKRRKHFQN